MKPPIEKVVKTGDVTEIFRQAGGNLHRGLYDLRDLIAGTWPLEAVHQIGIAVRGRVDNELAGRPALIADKVDALAARVEARPVEDWDLIHPTDIHCETVRYWVGLAKVRSALLERFADDLDDKFRDNGWVVGARTALAVLADVDLLLPGIDAELRPILTVYAGLDEPGSVTR